MSERNKKITVRFSDKEYAYLQKQVSTTNLNREEFVRGLIANKKINPMPCIHHAELCRDIAGMCNNLNQIAKHANISKNLNLVELIKAISLANAICKEIKEKWWSK